MVLLLLSRVPANKMEENLLMRASVWKNLQFLDEILLLGWIATHLWSMDEEHLQKTIAHL